MFGNRRTVGENGILANAGLLAGFPMEQYVPHSALTTKPFYKKKHAVR